MTTAKETEEKAETAFQAILVKPVHPHPTLSLEGEG
jgi:hypothetical protein